MNRFATAALAAALGAGTGCRLAERKYWNFPVTSQFLAEEDVGGGNAIGVAAILALGGIVDVVILPVTAVHDLIALLFLEDQGPLRRRPPEGRIR
ncbi:MAG: hypothetical protein L0216_12065 [Planctomycetales bacterium]|nr:hypothetical protein [Planctomycetales bacterium]